MSASSEAPTVSLPTTEDREEDPAGQEVDSVVVQQPAVLSLPPGEQEVQFAAGQSGTAAASRSVAVRPLSRRARQRANRRRRRVAAALAPPPEPDAAVVLEELMVDHPVEPPAPADLEYGGIPVQRPASPLEDMETLQYDQVEEYRVGAGTYAAFAAFTTQAPVMPTALSSLVAAEALVVSHVPDWALSYSARNLYNRPGGCQAFMEAVVPQYGDRHIRWVVHAALFSAEHVLTAVYIMPVLHDVAPPAVPAGFVPVLRNFFFGPSLQVVVPDPAPAHVGRLRLVHVHIHDSMIRACYLAATASFSRR